MFSSTIVYRNLTCATGNGKTYKVPEIGKRKGVVVPGLDGSKSRLRKRTLKQVAVSIDEKQAAPYFSRQKW